MSECLGVLHSKHTKGLEFSIPRAMTIQKLFQGASGFLTLMAFASSGRKTPIVALGVKEEGETGAGGASSAEGGGGHGGAGVAGKGLGQDSGLHMIGVGITGYVADTGEAYKAEAAYAVCYACTLVLGMLCLYRLVFR